MKLSAVTTLYYSEPFIREFYERLVKVIKKITTDYEIIFVNDGSPDKSGDLVLAIQETDPRVILVELSRNFGHHRALQTGLKLADGDHIFMIDSDLEEEPELLSIFWEQLTENRDTDAVFGVQKKRKGSWFEKISGKAYYMLFSVFSKSSYPVNTLTARLMTRSYVDGLLRFEEKEADLWGLFVLTGFREKSIVVNKKHKGKTTYSLRRKFGMAINTITTLTHRPLYIIFLIGVIMTLLSMAWGLWQLINYLSSGDIHSPSVITGSVWLVGGIVLLALGIISIYLSKMFLEVKNRPVSIIRKIYSKKHATN